MSDDIFKRFSMNVFFNLLYVPTKHKITRTIQNINLYSIVCAKLLFYLKIPFPSKISN